MEQMTVYKREQITGAAREFSPAMFNDFISWIDRGEQTTRSYLANLRQFLAWLRYSGIEQPGREDIVAFRQWISAEHDAITIDTTTGSGWRYRTDASGNPLKITCKANTAMQYLRSVCQFFKWTASAGLYPDIAQNIHLPKVKRDTHRKDALTAAEVLTIEKSIEQRAEAKQAAAASAVKDTAGRIQRSTEQGKRLYAMYLLTVNAGLRCVELHRANIKDIEQKNGQTWFYIWGKGHSEADQKKPLAPEVAEALRDYLQSRTDKPTGASPLFVSTGNRSGGRRIATTTISTMLKRAMQAAGFDSERITAHSLRHTAGTAVQEITGNLYLTQQYMRHASPATTEIYLHCNTEKAEAGIARQLYERYHGGGSGEGDNRQRLAETLQRLNPQQLERLAVIAQAMA